MTPTLTALGDLKRQRPEWEPWLVVIEEVLREGADGSWDHVVADCTAGRHGTAPLLAGSALRIPPESVRRLLDRLIRMASHDATDRMITLRRLLRADLDMLAMFAASLALDGGHVQDVATSFDVDLDALHAVVALVPVPFLQACHRCWKPSISRSWTEGYCPVCGGWPAFAEVRGIERSRFFRCGRCGGEWYAQALRCAYCGTTDHEELVALVPEQAGSHGAIEACRRCQRYVKTLTRLQGCQPGAVIVEDLASVALDLAALDEGYIRARGTGYALSLTVAPSAATRRSPAKRRFFGWN